MVLRVSGSDAAVAVATATDVDIHTTAGKLADFERRVQEATHAGSERAVESSTPRAR